MQLSTPPERGRENDIPSMDDFVDRMDNTQRSVARCRHISHCARIQAMTRLLKLANPAALRKAIKKRGDPHWDKVQLVGINNRVITRIAHRRKPGRPRTFPSQQELEQRRLRKNAAERCRYYRKLQRTVPIVPIW